MKTLSGGAADWILESKITENELSLSISLKGNDNDLQIVYLGWFR